MPYTELATYITQADVCLGGPFGGTVQSQYVIGGKTYQFMSSGKPVILGKNEESHLWTDKLDALIVDQANAEQLANAIIWAKEHPADMKKIAIAGKRLYDQKLSNKVLVRQLRTLLARKQLL